MNILINGIGFEPGKAFGAQTFLEGLFEGIKSSQNINNITYVGSEKSCIHLKTFNPQINYKSTSYSNNPYIRTYNLKNILCREVNPSSYDAVIHPFNIGVNLGIFNVSIVHDMVNAYYCNKLKTTLSTKIKAYFRDFVIQKTIKHSDLLFCPSKFTKDEIIKYTKFSGDKIFVVNHGITKYKKEYEDIEVDSNLHNLYLPSYKGEHKNTHCITDFLKKLRDNNNSIFQKTKIYTTGGSITKDVQFYRKICDYNLSESFVSLGYLSYDQLLFLYTKMTAVLFPSLYEGYGLPISEAEKVGCQVLCSDIPVFNEISKSKTWTFNPLDSNDLYVTYCKMIYSKPTNKKYEFNTWVNVWDDITEKIRVNL